MLDFLFTKIDDRIIDFDSLTLHNKPNQYLVLPEGDFSEKPHQRSPELKMSAQTLQNLFKEVAASQKKVTLFRISDDGMQLDYVQRTALIGYPDTITVRFYPQGSNRSALAVYSRSRYGYSDLGANEKRIKLWLDQLQKDQKQR